MDIGRMNDIIAGFLIMRRGSVIYPVLFENIENKDHLKKWVSNWEKIRDYFPLHNFKLLKVDLFYILEKINEKIQEKKYFCGICRLVRFNILARLLKTSKFSDLRKSVGITDGCSLNNSNLCSDNVDLETISLNYLFSNYPIFTPNIGLDLENTNIEEQKVKVEYNPNRPDFSSPEGIARALKGYYELELGIPSYEVRPGEITLNVDPSVKKVRPYIVCGVIRDIDLDEDEVATLMNIQEHLHWAVGRDRRKVAIGVHDLDKIVPPYRYTAVKPDSVSFIPLHGDGYPMNLEEILLLHDKGIEYAHILEGKDVYPIIFDNNNEVLSFPPIINGVLTTVTDDTENLFLDLTGTDFKAVNLALNILSTTLSDMGAKIESVTVNYQGGKEIITPNLNPTG